MAKLERMAISANPYEEFKNVYGKTEAYAALGGDAAYKSSLNRDATADSANAFIGTVTELQNRGGIDAFKAEYNTQYLTDYEKLLAAENEMFGDRTTMNTYTRYKKDDDGEYVFDDDGNYVEEEYQDTAYNYVKDYLAECAQTGIEKAQYEAEEEAYKNRSVWEQIGRAFGSILAIIPNMGAKAIDTFLGGFMFLGNLAWSVGTNDYSHLTDYNYTYLSDMMQAVDEYYTLNYDAHGNINKFGNIMYGISDTLGMMLPTMVMQWAGGAISGLSSAGKAANMLNATSNAATVTSKIIGLTYWYNLGYTNALQYMELSPEIPVWGNIITGFAVAAIQAGVTYMMSKTIGMSKLDRYTLGCGNDVSNILAKGIAKSGAKAVASSFIRSALSEGYRQFIEEEFQEIGQYLVEGMTNLIATNQGLTFNMTIDITPEQMLNACVMSYITSLITTSSTYVKNTLSKNRINTNKYLIDENGEIVTDSKGKVKYTKLSVAQSMDINALIQNSVTRAQEIQRILKKNNTNLSESAKQRLRAEINNLVASTTMLEEFFAGLISQGYTNEDITKSIQIVQAISDNLKNEVKLDESIEKAGGLVSYVNNKIIGAILADYHAHDSVLASKAAKKFGKSVEIDSVIDENGNDITNELTELYKATNEALEVEEETVAEETEQVTPEEEQPTAFAEETKPKETAENTKPKDDTQEYLQNEYDTRSNNVYNREEVLNVLYDDVVEAKSNLTKAEERYEKAQTKYNQVQNDPTSTDKQKKTAERSQKIAYNAQEKAVKDYEQALKDYKSEFSTYESAIADFNVVREKQGRNPYKPTFDEHAFDTENEVVPEQTKTQEPLRTKEEPLRTKEEEVAKKESKTWQEQLAELEEQLRNTTKDTEIYEISEKIRKLRFNIALMKSTNADRIVIMKNGNSTLVSDVDIGKGRTIRVLFIPHSMYDESLSKRPQDYISSANKLGRGVIQDKVIDDIAASIDEQTKTLVDAACTLYEGLFNIKLDDSDAVHSRSNAVATMLFDGSFLQTLLRTSTDNIVNLALQLDKLYLKSDIKINKNTETYKLYREHTVAFYRQFKEALTIYFESTDAISNAELAQMDLIFSKAELQSILNHRVNMDFFNKFVADPFAVYEYNSKTKKYEAKNSAIKASLERCKNIINSLNISQEQKNRYLDLLEITDVDKKYQTDVKRYHGEIRKHEAVQHYYDLYNERVCMFSDLQKQSNTRYFARYNYDPLANNPNYTGANLFKQRSPATSVANKWLTDQGITIYDILNTRDTIGTTADTLTEEQRKDIYGQVIIEDEYFAVNYDDMTREDWQFVYEQYVSMAFSATTNGEFTFDFVTDENTNITTLQVKGTSEQQDYGVELSESTITGEAITDSRVRLYEFDPAVTNASTDAYRNMLYENFVTDKRGVHVPSSMKEGTSNDFNTVNRISGLAIDYDEDIGGISLGQFVNSILSDDVNNVLSQNGILPSINDIICNPEMLADSVRETLTQDGKADLTVNNTYRYLNRYLMTLTNGRYCITCTKDGKFVYADMLPFTATDKTSDYSVFNETSKTCQNLRDKLGNNRCDISEGITVTVADILRFEGDPYGFEKGENSLYADIRIVASDGATYYSASDNTIYFSSFVSKQTSDVDARLINYAALLHEFSHAVQHLNGFANGSNPAILDQLENADIVVTDLYNHCKELFIKHDDNGKPIKDEYYNPNYASDYDYCAAIAREFLYMTSAGEITANGYTGITTILSPTIVADNYIVTPWGNTYKFKGTVKSALVIPIKNGQGEVVTDLVTDKGKNALNDSLARTQYMRLKYLYNAENSYFRGNNPAPYSRTEISKLLGKDNAIVNYLNESANHYRSIEALADYKQDVMQYLNSSEGESERWRSLRNMYNTYIDSKTMSFEEFLDLEISLTRIQSEDHLVNDKTFVSAYVGFDEYVNTQLLDAYEHRDDIGNKAYLFCKNIKVRDILYFVGGEDQTVFVDTGFFTDKVNKLKVGFELNENCDLNVYGVAEGTNTEIRKVPIYTSRNDETLKVTRISLDKLSVEAVIETLDADGNTIQYDQGVLVIQEDENAELRYALLDVNGRVILTPEQMMFANFVKTDNKEHNFLTYYDTSDAYRSDVYLADTKSGKITDRFKLLFNEDGSYTFTSSELSKDSSKRHVRCAFIEKTELTDPVKVNGESINATGDDYNLGDIVLFKDKLDDYLSKATVENAINLRNSTIDLLTLEMSQPGNVDNVLALLNSLNVLDAWMLTNYINIDYTGGSNVDYNLNLMSIFENEQIKTYAKHSYAELSSLTNDAVVMYRTMICNIVDSLISKYCNNNFTEATNFNVDLDINKVTPNDIKELLTSPLNAYTQNNSFFIFMYYDKELALYNNALNDLKETVRECAKSHNINLQELNAYIDEFDVKCLLDSFVDGIYKFITQDITRISESDKLSNIKIDKNSEEINIKTAGRLIQIDFNDGTSVKINLDDNTKLDPIKFEFQTSVKLERRIIQELTSKYSLNEIIPTVRLLNMLSKYVALEANPEESVNNLRINGYSDYLTTRGLEQIYMAKGYPDAINFLTDDSTSTTIYDSDAEKIKIRNFIYHLPMTENYRMGTHALLNDILLANGIDVLDVYSQMIGELDRLSNMLEVSQEEHDYVDEYIPAEYAHDEAGNIYNAVERKQNAIVEKEILVDKIKATRDELKDVYEREEKKEVGGVTEQEGLVNVKWFSPISARNSAKQNLEKTYDNAAYKVKVPGEDRIFVAKGRFINRAEAEGTNLQPVIDKAGKGTEVQMDPGLQSFIVGLDLNKTERTLADDIRDGNITTMHQMVDYASSMVLNSNDAKVQATIDYTYDKIAQLFAARKQRPRTDADLARLLVTGEVPQSVLDKTGKENYDYDSYGPKAPYLFKARALGMVLTAPIARGGLGYSMDRLDSIRIGFKDGVCNIDSTIAQWKAKYPTRYALYCKFLYGCDNIGKIEVDADGNLISEQGKFTGLEYSQGDMIIKIMKRFDGTIGSAMKIGTSVKMDAIDLSVRNSTKYKHRGNAPRRNVSTEEVITESEDTGSITIADTMADEKDYFGEDFERRLSYPELYEISMNDEDVYCKIIEYTSTIYKNEILEKTEKLAGKKTANNSRNYTSALEEATINKANDLIQQYGVDGVYELIDKWENNSNYSFQDIEKLYKSISRQSLLANIRTVAKQIFNKTAPRDRKKLTTIYKQMNNITDADFTLFTNDGSINPLLYKNRDYTTIYALRESLIALRDSIDTSSDYKNEISELTKELKKAERKSDVDDIMYKRKQKEVNRLRKENEKLTKKVTKLEAKKKSGLELEISHTIAMPEKLATILETALDNEPIRTSRITKEDGSEVKYVSKTLKGFIQANAKTFNEMTYQDWLEIAEFLANDNTYVVSSQDSDAASTYFMYTHYLLGWIINKTKSGALLFDADLTHKLKDTYNSRRHFGGSVLGAISAVENYINPERQVIMAMMRRYGIEYSEETIDRLTFILSLASSDDLRVVPEDVWLNKAEVIDENGKKTYKFYDSEDRPILGNPKYSPEVYDAAISIQELCNQFSQELIVKVLRDSMTATQQAKFDQAVYNKAKSYFELEKVEAEHVTDKNRAKLDTELKNYSEADIKRGVFPAESMKARLQELVEHGYSLAEAVEILKRTTKDFEYTYLTAEQEEARIQQYVEMIYNDDSIFDELKVTGLIYQSSLQNLPNMEQPVNMLIMTTAMKRVLTYYAVKDIENTALAHISTVKGKQSLTARFVAFEQSCMLSSPGTWLRNIVSNVGLRGINSAGAYLEQLLEKTCPPLAKQIKNKSAIVQERMKGGKINTLMDELTKNAYTSKEDIEQLFKENDIKYTDKDLATAVFIQSIFPVSSTRAYTTVMSDADLVNYNRELVRQGTNRKTYDKLRAIEQENYMKYQEGKADTTGAFNAEDAILKNRTCIITIEAAEALGIDMDQVLTDNQKAKGNVKAVAISNKQLKALQEQLIKSLLESNDGEYRAGIKHAILYKIVGTKVTSDMNDAVDAFLNTPIYTDPDTGKEYKLWDTIAAGLTRYSDDMKRNTKNDKPLENKYTMMIVDKFSREIVDAHKFDSKSDNKAAVAAGKALNKVTGWMYRMMSDNPFIKKRAKYYFTRMLTELEIDPTNININNGDVLDAYADAYVEAAWEYMHKGNFMREAERDILNRWGEGAWFIFKQIFPFGNASMNWAISALECSPYGLIKGIYQLCHLDKVYDKNLTRGQRFAGEPTANFTLYNARVVTGRGIIGTLLMGLGAAMAGLGVFRIDDEDDQIKVYLGDNCYLDVSDVFGTSSFLAGAGLIYALADQDNETFGSKVKASFTAVLNSMMKDNIIATFIESSKYNESFADYCYSLAVSTIGNFLPAFGKSFNAELLGILQSAGIAGDIQYASGLLGQIERVSTNIPVFGTIIGMYGYGYQYDIFTGEKKSTYKAPWLTQLISKFTPINLDWYNYSELELLCMDLGLNKQQLNGKYEDIGNLSQAQVSLLNQMYGKLNKADLTAFFNNKTSYEVQAEDGSYVTLTYRKMTDEQRANVVNRIMTNNAKYAKVYIWTKIMGGKYYATQSEFDALKSLNIRTRVFLETTKYSGFSR